jgi:glycosyltransferase involved in cell wall biosynthesis
MKNTKLNVGVFTHDFYPYVGGQGRYLYELYKQNIATNKINLFIFSPSENNLPGHIKIFSETSRSKFRNIHFSLKLYQSINYLINKYRLDVVHIFGGPGGLFLNKRVDAPVVFTCFHTYWQQSHYIKKQSWKKIFIFLEKQSYKKAMKNICISTTSQNILTDRYGIDAKKTIYIPCGINKSNFKPVKLSSHKNGKEVLYVGRLDERKGIKFLLESMCLINTIDTSIKLHIVGDGEYKDLLRVFSNENNLNVEFHGYVSDKNISKLYEEIQLQIIPSIFEGFGLTVIEAMAKKIPVIATNVDGISDIVQHNYNGILVEYGNKQELANAIINLLNDPKKREELTIAGYDSLKSYDWKSIYNQTKLVYEQSRR